MKVIIAGAGDVGFHLANGTYLANEEIFDLVASLDW